MAAVPVLDPDHFSHMTGHDPALQGEILALFRGQAQLWRRLILPDAPVQTWRDAVHSLKGSARGLGLWRLAAACADAEDATRALTPDNRAIARELAAVQAALSEALDALPMLEAANDSGAR